jgi:transglutaminase-like putative cysteine protease
MSTGSLGQQWEQSQAAVLRGEQIPWTLLGAALAAMAALYLSANHFIGLPVMAVAMLLSRLSHWRLPRSFIITYGLRLALLAIMLTLISQTDPQDLTPWYLKQADTNLVGFALAAGLVLHAWEKSSPSGAREGLGVFMLVTAFLFTCAANTYERIHIQAITPIYALFVLLSFRTFAVMQQPARAARLRGNLVALRAIVLLTTLATAFAGVYGVTRYEYQLENYAMRFVRPHANMPQAIGFGDPHLTSVFNPKPSLQRILLITGKLSDPHLRLATYDSYQGALWLPPASDRQFSPITPLRPARPRPGSRLLRIERLGDTADLIGTTLDTVGVDTDDPLERDPWGTLRDTRSGSLSPYRLSENEHAPMGDLLANPPDAAERKTLLVLPPEIDPRVIELARSVAGVGNPASRIMHIAGYLGAHHGYSLSFDPHGEPLSDFILNDRAAHCQYFASAMAIMARAADVPARFAAGFYAHESYGPDQIVVRDRDAHAWCECWIDGVGWMTVDATPPDGRPDAEFADASPWRRWWEKLGDIPRNLRQWLSDHASPLSRLAAGAALLWLMGWLIMRIVDLIRDRKPREKRYVQPDAHLADLARRFDRWLKRRGAACPPELTWQSHLGRPHRWQRMTEEQLECCRQFIIRYDRARYGEDVQIALADARLLIGRIERG